MRSLLTGGSGGNQVLVTDGTAAGTSVLGTLAQTSVGLLGWVGGSVLFETEPTPYYLRDSYQNPPGPYTLLGSDGTGVGTVSTLGSFTNQGAQAGVTLGGAVLFTSPYQPAGAAFPEGALYATNGTAAGTQVLTAGFTAGPGQYLSVSDPVRFGNRVVFSTAAGIAITDGTPGGTGPIDGRGWATAPYGITVLGGEVLYLVGGSVNGTLTPQLWRTDGTYAGTQAVASFAGASAGTVTPARVGGRVVFGLNQDALWASDGTAAGTQLVFGQSRLGLPAGETESTGSLTALGGRAVFTVNAGGSGAPGLSQLWTTDGTAAGTTELRDFGTSSINGTAVANAIGVLGAVGGRALFTVDPISGTTPDLQLWATDGTAAGTVELRDLGNASQGAFATDGDLATLAVTSFASAANGGATPAIAVLSTLVTDGTSAGTQVLGLPGTFSALATLPQVLSSPGGEVLRGGAAPETVFAAGADALYGGAGGITFVNGAGAGTVVGGSGAVTAFGGAGGGFFYGGGSGGNVLVAGAGNAVLGGGGQDDALYATGGANDVLVAGPGHEVLSAAGSTGADVLFGGSGADVLAAGNGADVLVAGAGSETLSGGAGAATTIFAGAGTDVVLSGAGGAYVQAGSGAMLAYVGGGADLFGFVSGQGGGTATITGFRLGTDHLSLQGYAGGAAAALAGATVSGGSTQLGLADGTRITLAGVTGLGGGSFV